MVMHNQNISLDIFGSFGRFLRKCLFLVLSFGPMPKHIAFIMDGNRRYAGSKNIKQGSGHNVGFTTLISTLQYCYEMGVDYVTVFAFSIDNFKREPKEVQSIMDLFKEKIDELLEKESIVYRYGIKINFWGNLNLLFEPVRLAAEKAMITTACNSGPVLSICIAYSSTDEITHAIEKSCLKKRYKLMEGCGIECNGDFVNKDSIYGFISVSDLEDNLYTANSPDPDIVLRTSGETRLSNFLLWQTSLSHLQNPTPLWPEFSLRHLVWAILEYQKVYNYLEARNRFAKKQS